MTAQAISRPRVEFAHLLRGFAAGSVLLSHLAYTFWRKPDIVGGLIVYDALPQSLAKVSSIALTDFGLPDFWGHFGVALFFLISGFVIPFSTARLSGPAFAIARAFRIWPTYAAGLTVALACLVTNATLSETPFPYSASEILNHYFIVPRWPTLTRPIDGIIWSLEIELFFYAYCLLVIRRLICGRANWRQARKDGKLDQAKSRHRRPAIHISRLDEIDLYPACIVADEQLDWLRVWMGRKQ